MGMPDFVLVLWGWGFGEWGEALESDGAWEDAGA